MLDIRFETTAGVNDVLSAVSLTRRHGPRLPARSGGHGIIAGGKEPDLFRATDGAAVA